MNYVTQFLGGVGAAFIFDKGSHTLMHKAAIGVICIGGAWASQYIKPYVMDILNKVPVLNSQTVLLDAVLGGISIAILMGVASYAGYPQFSFASSGASLRGFAWNVVGGAGATLVGSLISGFITQQK